MLLNQSVLELQQVMRLKAKADSWLTSKFFERRITIRRFFRALQENTYDIPSL